MTTEGRASLAELQRENEILRTSLRQSSDETEHLHSSLRQLSADTEHLRASLLQSSDEVQLLRAEREQFLEQLQQKDHQIDSLQHRLQQMLQRMFGRSAEKNRSEANAAVRDAAPSIGSADADNGCERRIIGVTRRNQRSRKTAIAVGSSSTKDHS